MTTVADTRVTSVESQAVGGDDGFLVLQDVVKTYPGASEPALKGASLDVPQGSFLVLLGPSGCGKTTTMRSIVGLETPDSGTIRVGGRTVFGPGVNVPVHKRRMGMVFQSYAVWPHRTVAENVGFPLKIQKRPAAEIASRVKETLRMVGLEEYADRSASALSGGQMQRVALARSVVMEPDLLLLDEPLSNLDAALRDRLRLELKRLQQDLGITSVYVTHDQQEALAMADKIAVMFNGVIHQFGDPRELYEEPASLEVASFVGKSNLLHGHATEQGGHVRFIGQGLDLVSAVGWRGTGPAVARLLVEDIDIHASSDGRVNEAPGRILVVVYEGSRMNYLVETAGGHRLEILSTRRSEAFHPGDEVFVSVAPQDVRVFPAPEEGVIAGQDGLS